LKLRVDETNFISNFAFPIVNKNKGKIVMELISNDIEVRPIIAGNMAAKPMWTVNHGHISLPNCEMIDAYGFYLPNHQDLTTAEILTITNILNKYE
jgi:CDP-6-deoxy-D-xylo-4-hexulose-3-dehydrase